MAIDFVAIDFETANHSRGSPCAVGVVEVRAGEIVAEHKMLMRPPEEVSWFDEFNTELHGISEDDVEDSDEFIEVLPWIMAQIGGLPVVAHNAAFDVGVLRDACDYSDIRWPELSYTCTLVLGRTLIPGLASYTLPFCLEACGLSIADHHDPLADARAAAELMTVYTAKAEVTSLDELLQKQRVGWGYCKSDEWRGSVKKRLNQKTKKYDLPVPDPDADGVLTGLSIVLTGKLPSGMVRREAHELIAILGGHPQNSVTKKTDVLVLGDVNPWLLKPGQSCSRKHEKALALHAAGSEIEIMAGRDFMSLLELSR